MTWTTDAQATAYRLYRTNSGVDTPLAETVETEFFDLEVGEGQTRTYRVSAMHGDTEGPLSEPVSGQARQSPAAPSNVVATVGPVGQVALNWNAPLGNISAYRVFQTIYNATDALDLARQIAEPSFVPRWTTPVGDTATNSFVDDNCQRDEICLYRIVAFDEYGAGSSPTPPIGVTGNGLPRVPLQATQAPPSAAGQYGPNSLPKPVQDGAPDVRPEGPTSPLLPECPDTLPVFVPGLGMACRTVSPSGYKIYQSDGTQVFTHGRDPAPEATSNATPPSCPTARCWDTSATAKAPLCVDDPTKEHHFQVVYAYPSDGVSHWVTSTIAEWRTYINLANGLIRKDSSAFGEFGDMRFRCGTTGLVDIPEVKLLTVSTANDNMDSIVTELKTRGYPDNPLKNYIVIYDKNPDQPVADPTNCAGGVATTAFDNTLKLENGNNRGSRFAVLWGWNCLKPDSYGHLVLHEGAHTIGAVPLGAPNTSMPSGDEMHCLQGWDTMCYDDDQSGPNEETYVTCALTRFDCMNDDYFHPNPPPGNFLSTHWNLGHQGYARFLQFQDDCFSGIDTASTFTTGYTIPSGNFPVSCRGTMADGDSTDYYRFSMPANAIFRVTMIPRGTYVNFDMCVVSPTAVHTCAPVAGNGQESLTTTVASTAGGTWGVRVTRPTTSPSLSGSYDMNIAQSDDCGRGVDASPGTAIISLGSGTAANGCVGSLSTTDTSDWYSINMPTAGNLLEAGLVLNAQSDYNLCVHNPSLIQVACSTQGRWVWDEINYNVGSTTGTWYASVTRVSGTGHYRLYLTQRGEIDCGTGEAGNTAATARPIFGEGSCSGSVSVQDQVDWYSFPLNAGEYSSAAITYSGMAVNLELCYWNPTATTCHIAGDNGRGQGDYYNKYYAPTTGTYFLSVKRQDADTGDYTITMRRYGTQSDCGTLGDADDYGGAPRPLTLTASCSGKLADADDDLQDWYSFTIPSGSTNVKITMDPGGTSNFDLCTYPPGSTGDGKCLINSGAGTAENYVKTSPASGTWKTRVYWRSGTTKDYTLTVCRNC